MAYQTPTDFFGLTSTANKLVVQSSSENKQAALGTGHNEKGDIVAWEVFGERLSPTCTYILGADYNLANVKCGEAKQCTATDYSTLYFVFGGITINTQAGSPPTIQVSGEEVPTSAGSHSDCTYTLTGATVKLCHHAQVLWDAPLEAADLGTGNYLQSANYTAGGTLSLATKDGEIVSYDITDGQRQVQATILQTGETKPTITDGNGKTTWKITSPLTCDNPDADYPTWTVTLSKYLEHDAQTQTNP